jgi:hypothetical protein
MHPVSMATAEAGQHQGTKALDKNQYMAAIRFGGEVHSPKPRPGIVGVSRNLSRAPTASLRDGLRPLLTEPVRQKPGRLPETTSTRATRTGASEASSSTAPPRRSGKMGPVTFDLYAFPAPRTQDWPDRPRKLVQLEPIRTPATPRC